MPGVSSKTKVMMVRLPVGMAEKVKGNAKKRGISISDYLRRLIVVQVGRKR